ncbi:hypothetical protein O1D97_10135 [Marinomonas sp. 15G1-11]|uniref:Uncharacterized protein n=1 Tax=Marinomonas phaeophyticola TaxID=3004091 RepID=A0ABT4JUB9_9GAMM|nr:hypothetical protein [Marinomonas sp. 15G1-11]MCZ2722001.1 hypothetical protein [Marinomonas sp. 15G1-11]
MKPFKVTDLPQTIKYQMTQISSDDARVSGTPDKTPFNRQEASEVHYLITRFASLKRLKLKKSLVKVAEVIHNALPEEAHTQVDALKWLQTNWHKF